MKTFLLLIIAFIPAALSAQIDTAITYSRINPVENTSKDELYSRAHAWFNATFKNAKDVLQITDRESGHLAGKGIGIMSFNQKAALGVKQTVTTMLKFNIDVWVKDGKYKYVITSIDATDQSAAKYHYGILTSSDQMPIKMSFVGQKKGDEFWARLKNETESYMDDFAKTLEVSMQKSASGTDF
ncbi:DUF4468 domain-containing protein [Chitinophaga sp. HK235]|uniref:DUF4468 domain-containing protein n=1 Tax=Chitinophaga sp. HK235 TaxID=2952571 RepID=UPI001BAB76AC|nr:DUF4468 domain-containing protein [Chitinophaga sp. HK235]